MEQSTPIKSSATNPNNTCCSTSDMEGIDLESLRRVFGSASPEDLRRRKAHELREFWIEKTKDTSPTTNHHATAKVPCFLLDPENEDHVAPHAVALQLLLGRNGFPANGDGLYKRVPRCESEDNDESYPRQQHQQHINRDNKREERDVASTIFGTALHGMAVVIAIVALTCQFVLEVLGGAGAIWGCAEIARLRKGGPADPSWDMFTWAAVVVGICCLFRFLLVHPFFLGATDPTFAEKYKLHNVFRKSKSRFWIFLEVSQLVAREPIHFLHPIKGHALSSCCGCYFVCFGNRWMMGAPEAEDVHNMPSQSRDSLGKESPQRSTWDLSDDDEDDHVEFVASAGP